MCFTTSRDCPKRRFEQTYKIGTSRQQGKFSRASKGRRSDANNRNGGRGKDSSSTKKVEEIELAEDQALRGREGEKI